MIIAEGTSSRHVNSIAQKIIEFLKNKKVKKVSTEGLNKSEWVLIDAGDILVHLFQRETREFYDLEKMWIQKIRPSPTPRVRSPGLAGHSWSVCLGVGEGPHIP